MISCLLVCVLKISTRVAVLSTSSVECKIWKCLIEPWSRRPPPQGWISTTKKNCVFCNLTLQHSMCSIVATPCDPRRTLNTLQLGDQGNDTIPVGSVTGCLRSENYPAAPYNEDVFDEITIPNKSGRTTLHVFLFNLEVCRKQWKQRYCFNAISCYLFLILLAIILVLAPCQLMIIRIVIPRED